MIEIKAPKRFEPGPNDVVVFLSGSIDMGQARTWRQALLDVLDGFGDNVMVLNPRRDDWDEMWEQTADFEPFREQVEWELQGLERADVVPVFFEGAGTAPITLFELGLVAGDNSKMGVTVLCEDGYWRRGNVEVVANRYGMGWARDFEDFIRRVVLDVAYACQAVDERWTIWQTSGEVRRILVEDGAGVEWSM